MSSIRAGSVLVAALGVCVLLPDSALADQHGRAAASVATHRVQRAPGKVADYWTARRMRRAEPLEIVIGRGGEARRSPAPRTRSAREPRSHVSYTSSEVTNPEAAGNRTNGVVFFHDPVVNDDFRCSGTAIDAPNRSLVLTAGHCVYFGQFVTKWIFRPGYHDGSSPFGTWTAKQLLAPGGWTSSFDCPEDPENNCPNFDFDVGMAVTFEKGGEGLENAVGARGIAFNQPRNATYSAYGYPAEPNLLVVPPQYFGAPTPLGPFGEKQWRCVSPYAGDDSPDRLRGGPAPMRIGCDMTGGSSGGGWVVGNDVRGLNSYGYSDQPEHLYGPYFGTEVKCLYQDASGQPPPAVDTVLLKHPKKKGRKRRATFRFAVDGSGADLECTQFGFQCRLDDRAWKDCSSGQITYPHVGRRKHVFRVRATEAEGNAEDEPARFKFKVKRRRG